VAPQPFDIEPLDQRRNAAHRSQPIVSVTRKGGFLSAASQKLFDLIRTGYAAKPSTAR
jgi:hypothetical protein